MAYKTILLHVAPDAQLEKRLELAARIALHEGAHLLALATGGSGPEGKAGEPARHANTEARARELVARIGLQAFAWKEAAGDACTALQEHAMFADLVIMGETRNRDFTEFVALNAACPTLLVPDEGRIFSLGDRILVGWNGSMEAARAVRDAMPLLQQAHQVFIAAIEAPEGGPPADPLSVSRLCEFLARQGVRAVVERRTAAHAGSGLLELAADLTSDLLVMGCRAHPHSLRFLSGGATRVALESATLPVFMSH